MILTKEVRIARHKRFLKSNEHSISAYAWENFLAKGKGMVIVIESDFVRTDKPNLLKVRFGYAIKGCSLMERISTEFDGLEWEWLEAYDPDEQMIVLVIRPEFGASGYLIDCDVKPSQAYAMQMAKFN